MNDPTNSKYRYLSFKGSSYRRYIKDSENNQLQQSNLASKGNEDVPAHGTYGSLLFDERWRTKRLEILKRDANKCIICSGNNGLQVHHRQYHFVVSDNRFKLPWEYDNHLLITLCEPCHKKGHNKFKVPTINI